ncbi:MAG: hypothetical protein EBR82_09330 [Caulobacteraceae bacterium]|nr:hypothetical protein [Caulobacteraceae bacterium]
MKKSLRLAVLAAGSIAIAGIGAAATAAFAAPPPPGDVALYDVVYYSDASKTVEVGRNYGVCYGGWNTPIWAGSSQYTTGEQTAYYSNEHVGWCTADGTVYF